ncbi:MAG: glycosyltransferase family 4 protein [Pseudomonadota bacterium]
MKIALINTISKTVDRPRHWWQLFGSTLKKPLKTDAGINFLRMADAIACLGNECHVFVSDVYRPCESVHKNAALKIHYLETIARFFFPPAYCPLLKGLYEKLKKSNYDIIQSSDLMQPSTVIAALAAKRIFVWQEQDQFSSRVFLRLLQMIYFNTLGRWIAKKTFFIPRSIAAQHFLGELGYRNILEVIPSGVDTLGTFHPTGLPEEYLLVVSRIAADKGFDLLLAAVRLVVKEVPSIKLLIKGDGPYRSAVEEALKKLALERNVFIDDAIASQTELNDVYNRAMLTIISTEGGLFPFVALESFAAGKPIVSSFARALKGLIVNNQTGFIVNTAEEMADRIVYLVENESERKRMGEEALKLSKNYDLQHVAHRFDKLYRGIKAGADND